MVPVFKLEQVLQLWVLRCHHVQCALLHLLPHHVGAGLEGDPAGRRLDAVVVVHAEHQTLQEDLSLYLLLVVG
jgi:hypothetical protein